MAHGKPDWNRTTGPVTTFQLDDVGESAVRLGSIVSYDRRGDVIWFDDHEATLTHYDFTSSGTGNVAARITTKANRGEACIELTTGNTANNQAFARRRMPRPVSSRIGLEAHFEFGDNDDGEVIIQMIHQVAGTQFTAQLVLDYDNDLLRYIDSGAVRQTLTDWRFSFVGELWIPVKLVVDLSTGNWVRALIGDQDFDLDGVAMQSQPVTDDRIMVLDIGNKTNIDANRSIFFDDLILTQNEP